MSLKKPVEVRIIQIVLHRLPLSTSDGIPRVLSESIFIEPEPREFPGACPFRPKIESWWWRFSESISRISTKNQHRPKFEIDHFTFFTVYK